MKKCIVEDKHEEMGKNCSHCFYCGKKIGKKYKEKCKEEASLIPIEKKQILLDELHNGKSIGEAKEIAGIDNLGIVCEIITQNIGVINYLKKEAL